MLLSAKLFQLSIKRERTKKNIENILLVKKKYQVTKGLLNDTKLYSALMAVEQ